MMVITLPPHSPIFGQAGKNSLATARRMRSTLSPSGRPVAGGPKMKGGLMTTRSHLQQGHKEFASNVWLQLPDTMIFQASILKHTALLYLRVVVQCSGLSSAAACSSLEGRPPRPPALVP